MTCIDCGRQTASYSGYCRNCGGRRFQNTDSLNNFWHRLKPDARPRRTSLKYDYRPRQKKSVGFFSRWWPLKLLFWPIWLAWKLAKWVLGLFLR